MHKWIQILVALFCMGPLLAQVDSEDLKKIEVKYGEQWEFCTCIIAQDNLQKEIMNDDLTDTQFDSLLVVMDSIDRHCKAFLVTDKYLTEEDKQAHIRRVEKCLRRHNLTAEDRFGIANVDRIKELEMVKELDLHTNLIKAEFYTRLHSKLGVEPVVIYGGYQFHMRDAKSGIEFMLQLKNGEFSYWGPHRSTQTLEVVDTFHDYIFNTFSKDEWVKGYTEFDTDNGHFTCGFMGGELFEEYDKE